MSASRAREPAYPWRVGAGLLAAVLLVAVVFYFFTRQATAPGPGADNAALQAAITPMSESVVAPTTAAPTQLPAVAQVVAAPTPDAPATQSGVLTADSGEAAGVSPTMAASAPVATPNATPSSPAQQVSDAYLRYFKVRVLAMLYLDPTLLPAVAADSALALLQQSIANNRANHRSVRSTIQHHFRVTGVRGDTADVQDGYQETRVWLDATTLQPLPPGGDIPEGPDIQNVQAVYHLRRIDGLWKVVDGDLQ